VDVSIGLAGKALDVARMFHQARRRVRVRVHQAYFSGAPPQHYFVSVTNLSAQREVVITHVWFTGPDLHVTNPDRPLPRRLALDEPWETWAPVHQVGPDGETRARVRLSTGKVVKSRKGSPPPIGSVPGSPDP
jgi:hypothetical protein